MRISERDRRLLSWLGEQLVVNKKELETLLHLDYQRQGGAGGPGRCAARDLIQRWRKYGLVETLYQSVRGVHCYVTTAGLRVSGLPYSGRKLTQHTISVLDHHDGVNRLRLHLEAHFEALGESCYWISERRLMQEQPLSRLQRIHRPDGVLVTFDGERRVETAIEVERTVKAPRRMEAILRSYVLGVDYDHVYFFYRDDRVQRALERALAKLPGQLPGIGPTPDRIHLRELPFNDT